MSHDNDTPAVNGRSPANRLGLDYRDVPEHRVDTRIVDIHTHVHDTATTPLFMEAASLYGVNKVVSMSFLHEVEEFRATYPGRIDFIAIPDWRKMSGEGEFQRQWLADLDRFYALGVRLMKFWVAPHLRGEYGLTLQSPFFEPLIKKGLDLDFNFMVHVADPTAWFEPGGRYADAAKYGTKAEQYDQLRFLLEAVAPRTVIAAHMAGNVEDPAFLQDLLDQYPNLMLDSSATKWIVRGVAAQPDMLRAFMIHNADRILFGSDLVVAKGYDFDHYASRYWTHRMLWESARSGESPIQDPDAEQPPRLVGLDLPDAVLYKLYSENAKKLGY